jgi:hypothetical protein
VRVGADDGVGERDPLAVHFFGEHDGRQILDVDLVHDAGRRRNHAQALQRRLPPAQELEALRVALELERRVLRGGIGGAEEVDLHRVVDHEVGRTQRVDPLGIAAQLRHRVAHHREVHDRRHAGQVLQHHPRGAEGDLGVVLARRRPAGQRRDVVAGDGDAVLVAQQVLEQDPDRTRKPRQLAEPRLFDRRQTVMRKPLARP